MHANSSRMFCREAEGDDDGMKDGTARCTEILQSRLATLKFPFKRIWF